MIKKYTIALATIFLLSFNFLIAQVGIGTTNPDPSAALDITSIIEDESDFDNNNDWPLIKLIDTIYCKCLIYTLNFETLK